MTVDEIIAPDDVLVGLRAPGKGALLEALATRAAARLGLGAEAILAPLVRREDLGSTGVGEGVALPHARLEGVTRPFGLLARLRDPVDYDAVDDRPVDLVCLLLLPAATRAGTCTRWPAWPAGCGTPRRPPPYAGPGMPAPCPSSSAARR